jgi:hypothetical protein
MIFGFQGHAIAGQPTAGTLHSINDSHEVDRGSLLGVGTAAGSPPGGLFAVGMLAFDEFSEFIIAGVRGWRLRIEPNFPAVPHLALSAFVNNASKNLVAGAQIVKRATFVGGRFYIEAYLVDNTNTEIDPANVLGIVQGPLGPNLISIGIVRAGNLYQP